MARRLLQVISSNPIKPTTFLLFGGIVFLIVLLVAMALCWKTRKEKTIRNIVNSPEDPLSKTSLAPDYVSGNLRTISYFSYRTLKRATGDFNQKNQLGGGGFGPVFKGTLDDGRIIAVKQLLVGKSQQGQKEFLAEVRMLTSIQHKNLVRLVGCCSEGPQRLLVYEFMTNGSLNRIISGKSEISLDWKTRFQIIIGVARGLQYLHEDSNLRIVHRDIKASNILLGDKFQPKISDFGLARFFPEDQTHLSTRFAGTLGYCAPEYALRGELCEKADIYSFGVLMLEIIGCRTNTDLSLPLAMQYLPEYAWKLYERSRLRDVIDCKLLEEEEGVQENEVLQICHIALLCLQPFPNLRPPMSEIVAMLTCRTAPSTTPVKPTFLKRKARVDL